MRESIKELVAICAQSLPILEPIYDFGSRQGPAQIGWADLRPYFPNKKYIGADMQEGPGVDVILDLQQLELPPDSVGTALCLETLEHVEFPRRAFGEVHRVLRKGGLFICTSHFYFPIHEYPHDYWRFTPAAFESLFKSFTPIIIDYLEVIPRFPHTVLGIGFKGKALPQNPISSFTVKYKLWRQKWSDPQYPWGDIDHTKRLSGKND